MSITQPELKFKNQQKAVLQLWDLFLIELTNWRWSWRMMFLSGTVTPLFGLGVKAFFANTTNTESIVYILTGNIVISLLFGTMRSLESRVSWLRFQGGIDFIATLPIKRHLFILAMVATFVLISLPSILVMILLGWAVLQVPVQVHPLILIVLVASAVPLSGIGALLALSSRTQVQSGNWAFLISLVMTSLGPVVVPPQRLPRIINILGNLNPAPFAASALRQVLVGPITSILLRDLIVLCIWSIISLWLVTQRINRRLE